MGEIYCVAPVQYGGTYISDTHRAIHFAMHSVTYMQSAMAARLSHEVSLF